MNKSNFEKWFDQQKANGLVDIKLAIAPGKGITNEAVQEELLAAEAAIASGFLVSAPKAMSTTPADIAEILRNSKVQAFAAV